MLVLTALLLANGAIAGTGGEIEAGPGKRDCFVEKVENGVRVNVYVGDRACVAFAPPRRFSGVWINQFEHSSFHEGAREAEDALHRKHIAWLSLDSRSVIPEDMQPVKQSHAYRITFIGQAARDMHRQPLEGYGHFGMSPGVVLVDRILAMEDLGPVGGAQ